MSGIATYKDLRICQLGMELADLVYLITREFPPEERFELTQQLRRAIVSVPINIAEGWGRQYTKSFINFLRISRGSFSESEILLEIALRQKIIDSSKLSKLENVIITEEGKMINGMINYLKDKSPKPLQDVQMPYNQDELK